MEERYDAKNILKFIIIVLLIACVFYGITILVSNKKVESKTTKNEETVIQYDNIVIGNMLKQKENEYYVFLQNKDDQNIQYYETYISNYKQKESALKMYYADLQSAFNKKYIGKENNWDENNFKIKETTLIKIRDSKILETYQGYEKILEELKKISE